MRFVNVSIGVGRLSAVLVAAGMILGSAADALAWGRYRDHIYADSFGNLVIQSPSGYKRIVVGQGHLAKELSHYERTGDADIVYLDKESDDVFYRDCYRPPHLWKGRSYMYGLPDGVVPQAPCAGE
jgi:hypothetical protein